LNTRQIAKSRCSLNTRRRVFINTRRKLPENLILYINKFWSLIMNNAQLFDLTSTLLQQHLILHKSCFDTEIIMQNRTAMQWQPKIPKERKMSQSNVILEEVLRSSKTSKCGKMKTNIIQAQQLSIWDKWQNMLIGFGDLLSKYQIITILLVHLRHIQCISVWVILGIDVVTVLWG